MSKLQHYLKRQHETQAKFAERTGMTQGNIAKLCGATPKLSIQTALKIERETNGAVPVESWPQFTGLAKRDRLQETAE